jgi:lipid-A-disaccharide synthase
MAKTATDFSTKHDWQPIIIEAESVPSLNYESIAKMQIKRFRSAKDIHQLMHHGNLGILKSGTTTLEAALMGLPGVICYKTSSLTYMIAKRLITLKFIGLANIVLGKKLYPELIQSDFTSKRIIESLEFVNDQKDSFTDNLKEVRKMLRAPDGSPSQRVAEILLANG